MKRAMYLTKHRCYDVSTVLIELEKVVCVPCSHLYYKYIYFTLSNTLWVSS